ncbi:hypothetical protein ACFOWA_07760 [Pedobacter lithocola]|uniref:Lipoprotein n=1 Tax=Pedobacter lithocola TaxID=1908239 RepID=A0ABV8P9M4_9SPHI
MKKTIILLSLGTLLFAACSGNKADEENADSMYRYSDTNKATVDTTTIDSARTKGYPDSTTNAPRMSGGNRNIE